MAKPGGGGCSMSRAIHGQAGGGGSCCMYRAIHGQAGGGGVLLHV